jgi:acetylornithine/succinyldiaminopimelate/putrescine aminotransferase
VRFMPPLVIDEADVDEAMDIVEHSLNEVMASGDHIS